jgi:hypothetical protein
LLLFDSTYDLSLTTPLSHTVLDVKGSKDDEIKNLLWLFDSGREDCEGYYGYGCIEPDSVGWYKETSEDIELQYKRKIPGLAFFHIPIPEVPLVNRFWLTL